MKQHTTTPSTGGLQIGTTNKLSNGLFEAIITSGDLSIHIAHPLKNIAETNAALLVESENMYYALKEYLKVINRTDAAKHYYGELTTNVEAIINRIQTKQP